VEVRLLIDNPARGAWNMAVDEALLETAVDGPPTLRFYQWSRPTLSLGYFQYHADRAGHSASVDCDLVRRATGGGAIVHDRELTYSYTTSADLKSRGGSAELYRLFHQTLIRAAATCGVDLSECGPAGATAEKPFLCFQRRSEFDLLIKNHKIVGSAQRRSRGAMLQHGSILLQASNCAPELAGIAEAAPPISSANLIKAWSQQFQNQGWSFVESTLSDRERELAEKHATEKYTCEDWKFRR